MNNYIIASKETKTVFCVERQPRGLTRVAASVAADLREITGQKPCNIRVAGTSDPNAATAANADIVIAAGVIGGGSWIDEAAKKGLIDLSAIEGKRECFTLKAAKTDDGRQLIIVAGSDLLGAEYGLYRISELCGVSPWHYWADVKPKKRSSVELNEDVINYTSKEPSIKLRGFFMNDEFPSLGNWVINTFGWFNERFYQTVFDLLLRLKGNFLWPAMWAAVFSEDGEAFPTASAELADEYGIVMGTSHHEPLYRAGEEFSFYMTDDNANGYGADWNYHTNTRGLYEFWEDSVKRNKDLCGLITVGMRGERDSKILGENATLKDNIDLLKKTITDQKKILRDNGLEKAPKVLALYKEVEDYFYGDENTEGLQSWNELDDVMFLLSDDNYGNTRTLPTPETRDREAGWGLYYHFDYHGGPISYEWVNSTPITKAWEQLTTAYQFGIKELWVANVGDLRPVELPLSYFMDLAYDYDKWSAINKTGEWLEMWTRDQFGAYLDEKQLAETTGLLNDYTRFNGDCRPEATHPETFSFTEEYEFRTELTRAELLEERTEELSKKIPSECADAFYGLVEFPALASANLRKMMIYTGQYKLYRKYGATYANVLASEIESCIARDKELIRRYNEDMSGGKWRDMMSSKHVDFKHWNDEGSKYPSPRRIQPSEDDRLLVFMQGRAEPFSEGEVTIPEFSSLESNYERIDVSCSGAALPKFTIKADKPWIRVERIKKNESLCTLIVNVEKEKLSRGYGEANGSVKIKYGDRQIVLKVRMVEYDISDVPSGCFVETTGVVSMGAAAFSLKHSVGLAGWFEIDNYGKSRSSMKVLPADTFATGGEDSPWLEYSFFINHPGNYTVTSVIAPTNDPVKGKGQKFGLQLDGGEVMIIDSLPEGFAAGVPEDPDWCRYVLDNCRRVNAKLRLTEGEHKLRFIHIDAGIVLQKIEIAQKPSKAFYGYREMLRKPEK